MRDLHLRRAAGGQGARVLAEGAVGVDAVVDGALHVIQHLVRSAPQYHRRHLAQG